MMSCSLGPCARLHSARDCHDARYGNRGYGLRVFLQSREGPGYDRGCSPGPCARLGTPTRGYATGDGPPPARPLALWVGIGLAAGSLLLLLVWAILAASAADVGPARR